MKIFCKDCQWYRCGVETDCCNHPANFADDYYGPAHVWRYNPNEQNASNDCELFKAKPRKRWWQR